MTTDEYGEVINHKKTYIDIAHHLRKEGRILIGWTDENGTHFDILFVLNPILEGSNIQGGIRQTDLIVGIMRIGLFGFEVARQDTNYGYIGGKLNIGGQNITTEKVAELINGVKKELND